MDRATKSLIFTALLASTTACKLGADDSHYYQGGLAVDSEAHGFYMKTKRDGNWVPSFCLAGNCGDLDSFGYQQVYLTTVEGDALVEGEKFGPRLQNEHSVPSYSHAEGFFLFARGAGWGIPSIHRLDGTVDELTDLQDFSRDPLLSRDGRVIATLMGDDDLTIVFHDTRTLERLFVYEVELKTAHPVYGWDEQGYLWVESEAYRTDGTLATIDPRSGVLPAADAPCFVGETSGGDYRLSDNKYVSTGDTLPLQLVENRYGEPRCLFE